MRSKISVLVVASVLVSTTAMLSGTAAAKPVGSPGQEGTCPKPYSIAFSDGTPFEYKDRNGNGFVCTWVKDAFNGPPHIQVIDDNLNKP